MSHILWNPLCMIFTFRVVIELCASVIRFKWVLLFKNIFKVCFLAHSYVTRWRIKITLIWAFGHQNIEGNIIADELARKETNLSGKDTIGMSIATCRLFIKQETLRQVEVRWKNISNCEISRQTWPCHNLERAKTSQMWKQSASSWLNNAWLANMRKDWVAPLRTAWAVNSPNKKRNNEDLLCH